MPPLFFERGGNLLLRQNGAVELGGFGRKPGLGLAQTARDRFALPQSGIALSSNGFGLI